MASSDIHSSEHLSSELLHRAGFAHAFFTRRGGVSAGPFATLNLSTEVGDDAAHVAENLRRAARLLGVSPEAIVVPRQVHGSAVIVHESGADPRALRDTPADAAITSEPGVACAVRTADCVPVLLADPESGRVAAVHAGWRGVVQRVVAATVDRSSLLGSPPERLLVAIGPHISAAAFEVGPDVAAELERASNARDAVERRPGRKPVVALRRIIEAQLLELGVRPSNIDGVIGCTYSEPERFFSHRRDGARSGRMLSAIVPKVAR